MTERPAKPLLPVRRGFSFLLLAAALALTGCGASSPRFAGERNAGPKKEAKKHGSVRFSSKEAEEEAKEDDRKVNVKEVQQRFSSTSAPATRAAAPAPSGKVGEAAAAPAGFEKQKMMDLILTWMGTPYEYGGESRSGTDCSGFTMQMFRGSAGMDLPRTTEEQMALGTPVASEELKFGDLLFFNTTGKNPSHVGIYIGDDMFAHASVSFGVTLSSMYSSYYKKRYTGARRIVGQ